MTCILSGIILMDWTVSILVLFLDISDRKWNLVVFWKKPRKVPEVQRKTHVGWLVLSQKMYPLKFGSCPVFYEITVFSFVINQSDRPEPRKELHRIKKSFSINGLYWWNFICATKMLSHVCITLYFRNNNLLHFSQELPSD